MTHEQTYVALRNAVLSRHFALGKFWRANLFTNVNVLGEISEGEFRSSPAPLKRACGTDPCVPRRGGTPSYREVNDPAGRPGHGSDGFPNPVAIPDLERWRVWYHDRGNALLMTGLRSLQLCVEHRLGQPLARRIIRLMLETTGSLFKWPADSPFGGYILRWDPATDDLWKLGVDEKGTVTPIAPCHWLLNSKLDGKDSFLQRRYLYCVPLADQRYHADDADRYRRYEPSKDEYLGLLTAYLTIFNTFTDDTSQEGRGIVAMVRDQTRRVATYLQRFGYLVVRPAGGVTLRGCGELFPLFEFPFNRVFERILGDEFQTRFTDGVSAYQRAFNDALGIDLFYPLHRTLEYDDAASSGGHEAISGLAAGNLPRAARDTAFRRWMSHPTSSIADGFKPYLAIMLLGTRTDSTQRNYLKRYLDWYTTTFLDPGGPDVPDVVKGAYDWTLATVVAMLVAHRLNRDAVRFRIARRVEQDLHDMAHQIQGLSLLSGSTGVQPVAVAGSSSAGFAEDTEGEHCSSSRLKVAAEAHDKQGNWYGFMVVLALTWQHLLDGGPHDFVGMAFPPPASVAAWPDPAVPGAVVRAAHTDRMPVPLDAISSSIPHPAADSHDVPLFDDPSPPKPADNTLGAPPAPQGTLLPFACQGHTFQSHVNQEFPYPDLVAPAEDVSFWKPAPVFEEHENTLVRRHRFWFEDGKLKVEVHLRGMQVHADGSRTLAKLGGTYSLAWVWSAG
jgi:hypothetical protein